MLLLQYYYGTTLLGHGVLNNHLCHITAAVDYYSVRYHCYNVTTTALHYDNTSTSVLPCCGCGAILLHYCKKPFNTTLTNHVPEHCFYSAPTTLVHHCPTAVRNYSYSTTTDALQFDGMKYIAGYDSRGLCLLRYYRAAAKPNVT
eukprot:4288365-Pyramimonas_sp.AAC.1